MEFKEYEVKEINLRPSTSCCNCIFNLGGYTSIKCDKGQVFRANYSSEYVCDFHEMEK